MDGEHRDDLVTLVRVSTEFEAEAIAEALQEAGVPAFAFAGMRASLPFSSPFTQAIVQVRQDDLERARETLARIRAEAAEIDWSDVEDADAAALTEPRMHPPMQAEELERPYQPRRSWMHTAFKIIAIVILMWLGLNVFGWIRFWVFGR